MKDKICLWGTAHSYAGLIQANDGVIYAGLSEDVTHVVMSADQEESWNPSVYRTGCAQDSSIQNKARRRQG